MFNKRVAFLTKHDQIRKLICCFVIAVEQAIRNDVMDIDYCLHAAFLLFAASLALAPVTLKRCASLLIPILTPAVVRCSIFVHRIVRACFVNRQIITHTAPGTKASVSPVCVMNLVYAKLLAALDTFDYLEVLRTAAIGATLPFAALCSATLRAISLRFPRRTSELFSAMRTRSGIRMSERVGASCARWGAIMLTRMIGIMEHTTANRANLHLKVFLAGFAIEGVDGAAKQAVRAGYKAALVHAISITGSAL